jgi:hypothetical protein
MKTATVQSQSHSPWASDTRLRTAPAAESDGASEPCRDAAPHSRADGALAAAICWQLFSAAIHDTAAESTPPAPRKRRTQLSRHPHSNGSSANPPIPAGQQGPAAWIQAWIRASTLCATSLLLEIGRIERRGPRSNPRASPPTLGGAQCAEGRPHKSCHRCRVHRNRDARDDTGEATARATDRSQHAPGRTRHAFRPDTPCQQGHEGAGLRRGQSRVSARCSALDNPAGTAAQHPSVHRAAQHGDPPMSNPRWPCEHCPMADHTATRAA